jgi:hypothetical protein
VARFWAAAERPTRRLSKSPVSKATRPARAGVGAAEVAGSVAKPAARTPSVATDWLRSDPMLVERRTPDRFVPQIAG